MYDAAYPPSSPPPWEVVAGYVGGDTPHVWSAAEWRAQPARWRLPIWTRSNPGAASEGKSEGRQAADAARALGMPARGCAIALDYELARDDAYLAAFDAAVMVAGYRTVLYGSLSSVFGNAAPSAGYWVAHYTGMPHIESGSVATQYASAVMLGTAYDASVAVDSLVLWDTALTPPAPAAPPPEDDMITSSNAAGRAGLSWSAGSKHIVQIGYDPAAGDPTLRVVLVQTSGPWVAPADWKPTNGTALYEIPTQMVPGCRGVILEATPATIPFDVYAE